MPELPDLSEAVATFRREPVTFLRVLLGVENPEDHQLEVMNAVAAGERQITMRSGRRVGKTALLDWLSIWFPMTRRDARVIVTAPAAGQLEDAYIPGFRQWVQNLPPELYALWNITADKFTFRMAEQQGFENFVTVRTARADNPEALQGINATNTLVLVDEAAGVPDIVLEALSGSLASNNSSIVLTGNPNRRSGFFYDTHTRLSDFWHTIHVNSEDSRLVSREWIEEKRQQWGQDSNAYRIHVLGEFPLSEDDTFIPAHLVESAVNRDIELYGPVLWGVDVARWGDDLSALVKRRTNGVVEIKTWRKLDTQESALLLKAEWDATPAAERPTDIYVDPLNMGSGVADRLREMGLPALDVNVSELPANPSSIGDRLRDDLWLQMKAALESREFVLPNNEMLRAELCGPRMLPPTATGKTKVESKTAMRSRGLKSPNVADALAMTFAGAAARAMGKRFDRKQAIKRRIRGIV